MNVYEASSAIAIPSGGTVDHTVTGTRRLISVVMALAASAANVFTVELVRGGITYILNTDNGTYETSVWLLAGGITLLNGDVLRLTNTAAQTGTAFYSYELSSGLGPSITATPGVADQGAADLV